MAGNEFVYVCRRKLTEQPAPLRAGSRGATHRPLRLLTCLPAPWMFLLVLWKSGRRNVKQVEFVYVFRGTLCLPPVASGATRSAMAQGYGGPRTGPPLPLGTPNPLPALGACGPPVPRPRRKWTPPVLAAWIVLPAVRVSAAESNYNNSSSRRRPRGWLVLPSGQLSACPDGMQPSFHRTWRSSLPRSQAPASADRRRSGVQANPEARFRGGEAHAGRDPSQ